MGRRFEPVWAHLKDILKGKESPMNSSTHLFTSCNDDDSWDQLVSSSQQSNPFLKSSFLSAAERKDSRILLLEDGLPILGTCILAGSLSQTQKENDLNLYQGIFFPNLGNSSYRDENRRLKLMSILSDEINKSQMSVALSLHPEIIDTRGIEWFFYENRKAKVQPTILTKYTGVIKIASHDNFASYQNTIRKARKQEIKKSIDLGMQIQENTDRIEEFVMLYEKTFSRQGIKLSSMNKDRVSGVIHSGISTRQGKLDLIYLPNGEPVSGMYTLSDDKSDYYLYGATDPKHRSTFGSTHLMLNAIERTFLENKTLFDFCGMNSPQRGEYKSSFNARIEPYFEIEFKPIREVHGG